MKIFQIKMILEINKTITIETGSYQISDYNKVIQSKILANEKENPISIYPDIPTSRIIVEIAKGYLVVFDDKYLV